MIIFNDINNNILTYRPSYSGVYQDEYENWELYQNIYFLRRNQNKKLMNFWCMLLIQ